MKKRRLLIKPCALLCVLPLFSALSFAQANSTASPSPAPSPAVAAASPIPSPSSNGSSTLSDKEAPKKRSPKIVPPEKAQALKIPLFAKPPVIDGKLDDDIWKSAALFKDFYQWRPSDSSPPSARTEVFAGYDTRFLYFAFHAYDEPSKVRASVAKRDNIFDDDVVGLILDTFNDKRRAYELLFNPLGIQMDGFLTEGGNDDFSRRYRDGVKRPGDLRWLHRGDRYSL
jgi:hypothetical protein